MKNPKKDFCTVTDEVCQTEMHLLLELRDSSRINFIEHSVNALTAAIKSIKATLLAVRFRYLFPYQDLISSVTVLASHTNNSIVWYSAKHFMN